MKIHNTCMKNFVSLKWFRYSNIHSCQWYHFPSESTWLPLHFLSNTSFTKYTITLQLLELLMGLLTKQTFSTSPRAAIVQSSIWFPSLWLSQYISLQQTNNFSIIVRKLYISHTTNPSFKNKNSYSYNREQYLIESEYYFPWNAFNNHASTSILFRSRRLLPDSHINCPPN